MRNPRILLPTLTEAIKYLKMGKATDITTNLVKERGVQYYKVEGLINNKKNKVYVRI